VYTEPSHWSSFTSQEPRFMSPAPDGRTDPRFVRHLLEREDAFRRPDEGEDSVFYGPPRLVSHLDTTALDRHTHLIISDGEYEGAPAELAETIERWTEAGGVLILIRGAADWAQHEGWLPDPRLPEPEKARLPYGEMAARDDAQQVGGAILKVTLDESHPLSFGIRTGAVGLMRRGTTVLRAPWDNPFTVVGAYAEDPIDLGYLPDGLADTLGGTPAILAVPKGEGVIIAFADGPAFRGVWWVGQRLLSNAISFGSVIDAPEGRYGPDGKRTGGP